MDVINYIIIFFTVFVIIALPLISFLVIRKNKHKKNHLLFWGQYQKALQENDVKDIEFYCNKLLWNDYLTIIQKEVIYNDIEKLKELYPELLNLWKDVYFRCKGKVFDVSKEI